MTNSILIKFNKQSTTKNDYPTSIWDEKPVLSALWKARMVGA